MGNITNLQQHEQDIKQLAALAELVPVYTRHLSHHLRNPLTTIIGSIEMAQLNLSEKNLEALQNDLARVQAAAEHLASDIREASL